MQKAADSRQLFQLKLDAPIQAVVQLRGGDGCTCEGSSLLHPAKVGVANGVAIATGRQQPLPTVEDRLHVFIDRMQVVSDSKHTTENREVTGSTPVGATRVIITSPQKPSRSFYPRGFCFALVRGGFRVAPGFLRPIAGERSARPLSERGETRRPRRGAWAGLGPVGVGNGAK